MNVFKASLFTSMRELKQQSLYIEEEEIKNFWEEQSLTRMEELLTIRDERIVAYITEYLNHYLVDRKTISSYEAYYSRKNNKNYMYFYDCKIFRSMLFLREENQMLSSFLVVYKDQTAISESSELPEEIYQFVDPSVFKNSTQICKCKASYILKFYSLFKALNLQQINGDVVIIPYHQYYKFLYSWMHYPLSITVEAMVKHLFRGLMILLQNSIMLEFLKTLSHSQKQKRRYEKPVAVVLKPKIKQSATMIENGLGDVQWHTLKIKIYQLKYKTIEKEDSYLCYREREEELEEAIEYDDDYLSEEDTNILKCFSKLQVKWIPANDYY